MERAVARIDLGALRANCERLRAELGEARLCAVVKADGYGHGAVDCARAAVAGGASWLGVADVREALALRAAGIRAPVLAWLHGHDPDFTAAVELLEEVAPVVVGFVGGGDGEERGAAGERRLGHRVGAVAVAVGLHHRAEPRLTQLGPQPFAVGAHGAEVDPGDRPLHG